MTGLDTNVLVCFPAQDEAEQSAIAARVISRLTPEEPGFISSVVLAEISWVFLRRYSPSPDEKFGAIPGLLGTAEPFLEDGEAADRSLAVCRAGDCLEFADALIAETAALAGVGESVTFDRSAATVAGMRLLEQTGLLSPCESDAGPLAPASASP